jgi:PTS system mannose-specific IID component
MRTGRLRAILRLFAVQGTWNYERMLGVGMGYAAEPLLEDLKAVDPVRHGEAVVRSAEFFNCNPNLAGLALGATTRAEYEAVPGAQIVRLRTALCSPLGAMGDELFWVGLVPALVGFALIAAVLGAGWWAIGGLLVTYNAIRLWTSVWSLRTGMASGMRVGAAIGSSWLPHAIELAGPAAGFAIGAALPLVADWYLKGFGWSVFVGAAGVAVAGVALTRWFGPTLTSVRFAILAMLLLLVFKRIGL